ncbi:MAG: thrombospondin type-1 domain-containing protein, partial [Patescibacteria group bacterium]
TAQTSWVYMYDPPTGSWTYPSSCPTACGTTASTQTQVCTGGNGVCSGSASSRSCPAVTGTSVSATIACSDPAAAPYVNGRTIGTASYTYNSCTNAIISTDTSGCTAPAPTTAPSLSLSPSTVTTAQNFQFTWSAVNNTPTRYEFTVSMNEGAWNAWASLGSVTVYPSSPSTPTSQGMGAATYAVQIRGCNAVGCGPASNTRTLTVTNPAPTTAPSLSLSPSTVTTAQNFQFTWSAVNNTPTRYEFTVSMNEGAWNAWASLGSVTVYPSSPSTPTSQGMGAATYAVQIRGCNAVGCGPASNTRTLTVNPDVPSTPTLTVKVNGTNVTSPTTINDTDSVTAGWTSTTGATYKIKLNGVESDLPATPNPINYSALPAGTYAFQVKACNTASGCSDYSSLFTLTVVALPTITLTWEQVQEAANYRLEVDNKANGWNGSGSTCSSLAGDSCSTETSVSKTFTGVPNASYTVRVYACNTAGCSTGFASVNLTCTQSTCSFTSTVRWGAGLACLANYNGTLQRSSSALLTNTAPNYTGQVTYTCNANGTLAQSNPSCSAVVRVDGVWSACSASCGGGTRSCTNPAPANGGAQCLGSTSCNTQPCNSPPSAPTISGPTTGNPSTPYMFTFTATDPQNDQIRYGIDWSEPADGVADTWLPSGITYVNSGTPQSVAHSWIGNGSHRFRALAQDAPGRNSSWSDTYQITLSARPSYIITASAGAGGTISPSGLVSVSQNSDQSFTITPNARYRIASVLVDGVNAGALSTRNFANVNAPHTITASFASSCASAYFCLNGTRYQGDPNIAPPACPRTEQACPANQTCSEGACLAPASPTVTGHLRAVPSLLRSGETARLYWSLENVSSCSVTGTNEDGTGNRNNRTGVWNGGSSGTAGKESSPIISQTIYTLTCMPLPGALSNAPVIELQTVNIIPIFEEL